MKNRIEIDAKQAIGEIDPMIYGHFIENMARCIYGGLLVNERPGNPRGPWRTREGIVDAIKELKPPVMRWPGGLYADGYDWRDGVGSLQARPLRRNRYWSRYGPLTRVFDPNAFGTHEFMEFAGDVETVPYVNVNLGSGTAEEAARWVDYVNGTPGSLEGARRAEYGREKPWGVRYWGIGNEIYGVWAIGNSGPREYARKYLEFTRAMDEVDPMLTYVAVGADQYLHKSWNREVLDEAGDRIDLLSIHIYLPGLERALGVFASQALRGNAGVYRSMVAAPLEMERRLRLAAKDIEAVMGKDSGVRVALDEWNLWWLPQQLIIPRWTLRDALFVCGTFHAMHRCSKFVGMANIAQLVNVLGLIGASGKGFHRTALYYPFLMYANLAGPTLVAAKTECATFFSNRLGGIPPMDGVPVLDCSATLSGDGKRLSLFVINRNMEDDVEVEIFLGGFAPGGGAEVHCLNGPQVNAVNRAGNDEVVGIEVNRREAGDILPRCRFPAHSATAIVLSTAS